MDYRVSNRLSASNASRSVTLLPNQQVELVWDHLIMVMRLPDLIVLNNALRQHMEDVNREWVEIYRLSLNACVLFIHGDDLYRFCDMVQEATEQLPRRTVRWTDLEIRLAPYTANQRTNVDCFSRN